MYGTNTNITTGTGASITNISSTIAPFLITTNITTNNFNNITKATNGTSPAVPTLSSPSDFPFWFQVSMPIVAVLSVFGNGIVVYFIVTRHHLRTKTNFMVSSLAVSDLLVGILLTPSYLACMHVECDNLLSKLFYDAFLFVSVCNLCCITFDRYLAVTRPLKYYTRIIRLPIITMITISWIVPSIVSLVPVAWLYSNTNIEDQRTNNKIFYTMQVVLFMFCPCLIMLIAYAVIFNIARKQARRITALRTGIYGNSSRSNSILTSSTNEAKVTLKVFGSVVVMFVACWSLSAFRTIVTQYELMEIPWNVTNASRLLLVGNSAVNPVIYAVWKNDINNEIKKLLKLVKPSSATFRSGQGLSKHGSQSLLEDHDTLRSGGRRCQANSAQESISMRAKKTEKNSKDKPLSNGNNKNGCYKGQR